MLLLLLVLMIDVVVNPLFQMALNGEKTLIE